jgi:hypothetical protein
MHTRLEIYEYVTHGYRYSTGYSYRYRQGTATRHNAIRQ